MCEGFEIMDQFNCDKFPTSNKRISYQFVSLATGRRMLLPGPQHLLWMCYASQSLRGDATKVKVFASVLMRILVANRGEVAARIIKTCSKLEIESVAVYTDVDALSLHEVTATESVCLGANPRSYTDGASLIKIAKEKGCNAVHPGYGFLSENIKFASACEEEGLTFLGPSIGQRMCLIAGQVLEHQH